MPAVKLMRVVPSSLQVSMPLCPWPRAVDPAARPAPSPGPGRTASQWGKAATRQAQGKAYLSKFPLSTFRGPVSVSAEGLAPVVATCGRGGRLHQLDLFVVFLRRLCLRACMTNT